MSSHKNEDRMTKLPLTVNTSNSEDSEGTNKRGNPWPHLDKYFTFKYCKENVAIFSCVLCLPKDVIIKGHMSSLSNLKSHIKRKHKEEFTQFDERIKAGSRRGQHHYLVNKRVTLHDASLDHFMCLKDNSPSVGVFQETERNSAGGVEGSTSLQNCISFINVDQIKTENDDPVDIHEEPLQSFPHQQASQVYSEILENSFNSDGRRDENVPSTSTHEPETKKTKLSSVERTDEIIAAINRLEKNLISETNKRQEDLFDVFGRSVSDQLRQLPRRQAIMAQSKIQNLLIQELLEYDNLNTSKTQEQPP